VGPSLNEVTPHLAPASCAEQGAATTDLLGIGTGVLGVETGVENRKTKQNARIAAGVEYGGSPTWARTRDLRINSPSLYRLSYRGSEGGEF
jgi:hypothetical protein